MKRSYALVVGFALLLATPGVATADITRPLSNQQVIQFVIARALAQRGECAVLLRWG